MCRVFQGKGDVWRFLQDLSDKVDGRTFSDEQYQDVMLLRGLVHEVTGVKINAFFKYALGPSESLMTERMSTGRGKLRYWQHHYGACVQTAHWCIDFAVVKF
jgi:hypothetical protein